MIRILNLYRRYFWHPERYARHLGVRIGQGCRISTRHFGSEPYLIEIGDRVQITDDVRFFTHGGGWVFRDKYPNLDTFGKVRVGNNVYIGNCALIMPGVIIEDNVVVGAGSVVTKSIRSGSVIAGNPARVVGKIEDLEIKMLELNCKTKGLSYVEKRDQLLGSDDFSFIKKDFIGL